MDTNSFLLTSITKISKFELPDVEEEILTGKSKPPFDKLRSVRVHGKLQMFLSDEDTIFDASLESFSKE